MVNRKSEQWTIVYKCKFSNPMEFDVPGDLLIDSVRLYSVEPPGWVDKLLDFDIICQVDGDKRIRINLHEYHEQYLLLGNRCVMLDAITIHKNDFVKMETTSDGDYKLILWPSDAEESGGE